MDEALFPPFYGVIPDGCISLRDAFFRLATVDTNSPLAWVNEFVVKTEADIARGDWSKKSDSIRIDAIIALLLDALCNGHLKAFADHEARGRIIIPSGYWSSADADVALLESTLLSVGSNAPDLYALNDTTVFISEADFQKWHRSLQVTEIDSEMEKAFISYRASHAQKPKKPSRHDEEREMRKLFPATKNIRAQILALREKHARPRGRPLQK